MRAIGLAKVLAFYAALFGVGLLALWRMELLATLAPLWRDGVGWLWAAGGGGVSGLLLVVTSRIAARRLAWAARLTEELKALVGSLGRGEAFALAVLSGLGEETLFRGVLQPTLGLWLSAALFGILHVGPNVRFLPWGFMAFVAGLVFGGLTVWSGTLFGAIMAHAIVNYLNLRFLSNSDAGDQLSLEPVGGEQVAGL